MFETRLWNLDQGAFVQRSGVQIILWLPGGWRSVDGSRRILRSKLGLPLWFLEEQGNVGSNHLQTQNSQDGPEDEGYLSCKLN